MAILDVPANKLIEATALELEKQKLVTPPEWAGLVKSGAHAERVPQQKNFWYLRTASVLLTMYKRPTGVRRLRRKYGGPSAQTVARHHHKDAGGKIIRLALQQLEKAGFLKKEKVGRKITPKGVSFLTKTAKTIQKG
ncbi:MAG TPA: 40S ribosomal protein S19 [Candidatus Norongarragalinales archaeon]|jgi:small subunit ribosomal protein S19e|nr:40S ribosomal protein S19 [Candidatus Norongarragalinales archaeon]